MTHGIEEIRIDTHPYKAKAPDTIESVKECLMQGHQEAIANPSTGIDVRGIKRMHSCYTNISTFQTWSKSADLGRRCPFHYNHWSCDGGVMGGRQIFCRCRVGVKQWSQGGHVTRAPAVGEGRCHLIHYNSNQYRRSEFSKHGGNPAPLDTFYQGPSPIAGLYE